MEKNTPTAEILSRKGIKPSYARIRIYDYLLEKRNHPTVEDIYAELTGEIPTLSRTTVYNTLGCFKEKGLLQHVTIEENELRYDADTAYHGHFKCNECGKVYDFKTDIDTLGTEGLEGFEIEQKSVYYSGKCKNCAQNQRGERHPLNNNAPHLRGHYEKI
jgi:Fur family peroxide stress response transcriptional regulator